MPALEVSAFSRSTRVLQNLDAAKLLEAAVMAAAVVTG